MKKIIVVIAAFFLTSCIVDSQIIRKSSKLPIKLNSKTSAYVALPREGRSGNTMYYGSGDETARAIVTAFTPYLEKVETDDEDDEYKSYKKSLKHAKDKKYDYLIFTKIQHWEDRLTWWSGSLDRVSIKVTITDVPTSKRIDSVILKTDGGEGKPQNLLPEILDKYVKTLF